MRIIMFAVLILFIGSSTARAASEFVVIASSTEDKSYQPGAVLNSGQIIKLPEGSKLTVLSKSGKVTTLKGPYSGKLASKKEDADEPASQEWSSTVSRIAKLVTKDTEKSNVVGASRGFAAVDGGKRDVWLMTVDSSGHRCVRPSNVVMWRKEPRAAISINLRSKSAKRTGLLWGDGEDTMQLPPEFVEDGILIVMKIDKQPRRFNLHVLPGSIGQKQWGKVLMWMIDNNCSRQSYMLIDALHDEPSAYAE